MSKEGCAVIKRWFGGAEAAPTPHLDGPSPMGNAGDVAPVRCSRRWARWGRRIGCGGGKPTPTLFPPSGVASFSGCLFDIRVALVAGASSDRRTSLTLGAFVNRDVWYGT